MIRCTRRFVALALPFLFAFPAGEAAAQAQTDRPEVVAGAKPVTVERIRVHGAHLEAGYTDHFGNHVDLVSTLGDGHLRLLDLDLARCHAARKRGGHRRDPDAGRAERLLRDPHHRGVDADGRDVRNVGQRPSRHLDTQDRGRIVQGRKRSQLLVIRSLPQIAS